MANYEKKKTYSNDKKGNYSNKPRNDRPRNKNFDLTILKCAKNHSGNTYSHQGVVDMLNEMNDMNVFACVSVPVWMNKADCSDDPTRKGKMVVGFIRTIKGEVANCSIFGNYVEYVEKLANPVVYLRGYVNENAEMLSVQSFEVGDTSRYTEFAY